jgi:hypothetical protein
LSILTSSEINCHQDSSSKIEAISEERYNEVERDVDCSGGS